VQHSTHDPVRTSEEAAKVRGVSLASGAKAMLVLDSKKAEEGVSCPEPWSGERCRSPIMSASPRWRQVYLIVLSAANKLDWKKVKASGFKGLRMATEDEVLAITGKPRLYMPDLQMAVSSHS
jgi:prolyl-tRNA editing enzyme YbaK/EbsC (Cys-tRNA(Pro) deacylase)